MRKDYMRIECSEHGRVANEGSAAYYGSTHETLPHKGDFTVTATPLCRFPECDKQPSTAGEILCQEHDIK